MRLMDLRQWFSRSRPMTTASAAFDEAVAAAEVARPRQAVSTPWPQARLDLLERLWGEGHVLPGGDEEVMRLATPLGLSAASSLLLIGAGFGGPARVIARELGAWVNGLEADPTLVAVATERLAKAGRDVSKRASAATWDPRAPVLKRHGFHHAVVLDPFIGNQHASLIAALAQAIKPGGQLVLVQLAADAPLDASDPAITRWAALEHRVPEVPLWSDISQALARNGLDVRVFEDISARHQRMALQGWIRLVRGLAAERPSAEDAAALVREVELWMRRIALLRAGSIRLLRWHAIAGGAVVPARA